MNLGPDAQRERVEAARQELRAPQSAGIAGILFAVLFTAALFLLRQNPGAKTSQAALVTWFEDSTAATMMLIGLYVAPAAGVAFLWFIAVLRDRIGDLEDRFFSTIFFGSGVIFIGSFYAAAAMAGSLITDVRFRHGEVPTLAAVQLLGSIAYSFLFMFGIRAGGVFLITTATIGLRTRVLPRWLVSAGYVSAAFLLVVTSSFDWVILLIPAWVGTTSVVILRRALARSRAEAAPAGPSAPAAPPPGPA